MKFTFLHTADWQIGKRFGSFPGDTAAVLRDQRLQAVDRLAQVAIGSGCAAVLVAGDVFDAETVPGTLSGQLLARLKAYPALTWHLLPGNHDPGRAGGVWSSLVAGLPANVQVHLDAKPAELAGGVILLPAPLMSKRTSGDPTAWMDGAPSPAGALRIGLAHGSVQGFGSAGDANVPIDPARVKSAALSYLALGDWHGTTRISDRAWYSGTPEPDGFRDNDPGNALIVRLDGAAPPAVEPVATAHFSWSSREVKVDGAESLEPVEADVARLGVAAARTLLSLQLAGTVAMTELGRIEERLGQLGPQLFHLAFDMSGITAYADVADLAALASPALSEIAQRLKAKSDQGGAEAAIAQRALRRLFALASRAEAGGHA